MPTLVIMKLRQLGGGCGETRIGGGGDEGSRERRQAKTVQMTSPLYHILRKFVSSQNLFFVLKNQTMSLKQQN